MFMIYPAKLIQIYDIDRNEMLYNQIIAAIPRKWKNRVLQRGKQEVDTEVLVNLKYEIGDKRKTHRQYYSMLVTEKYKGLKCKKKMGKSGRNG